MPATLPPDRYVPPGLDVADFSKLETLYRGLLFRPVDSVEQLRRWMDDFSELTAVVDEYGSRKYIDKSCHTDDKAVLKRYLDFVENVEPKIKPLIFQLQKKYLQSSFADQMGEQFEELRKKWQADVEIFREENIAIETELTRRVTEFDQINGRMMVHFRGQDYTMQQMARFQEEPDRATRREAWESAARRRLNDRDAIETIFEGLLPLRQQIAGMRRAWIFGRINGRR